MNVLCNYLENMKLGGAAGDILSANEAVWLHNLLTDNPGLFDGFRNPSDEAIFKTMWHGEFPGKLLTGIAQTYLLGNHPKTREVGDRMVTLFKEVQEPCGYLGPWPEAARFNKDMISSGGTATGKWDTWGQYHCIYGLYRWYQVTGNPDALEIARKALDHIYDYFIVGKQSFASQKWAECNFAVSHAFALFYEETKEVRYLQAAEYMVNEDWKTPYQDFYSQTTLACNWMEDARKGIPFFASNQPRWESLYALETLAVLYRITGKALYRETMDSLWWGMVGADRHNTGSFGTGEGATGNPYGTGSETCNTVAWMAFSTDYLKLSRSSYIADELELSHFNATLGSLLEGERNFTYMNDSNGTREAARIVLKEHSYKGARDMSCCQANGNRGLSQIAEWAVLTEADSLYLNYYGSCSLVTRLENGQPVTISQQTDYPKTGHIQITVAAPDAEAFTLYLRIPSWSFRTELKLNGRVLEPAVPGQYYALRRQWKAEDILELTLDMGIHFWVMNYARINYRVSAYSGPVLLAFQPDSALRASARFTPDALRNAQPADGTGLVNFKIRSEQGQEVAFTDYYTAGKSGKPFVSWLICPWEEPAASYEKNNAPVWCTR